MRRKPPTVWTRALMIARVQAYVLTNEELPRVAEVRAYLIADFPTYQQIVNEFGTWNGLVEAAGYERRPQGRPAKALVAA